jgi:superfamily II DNA or RNA helicase
VSSLRQRVSTICAGFVKKDNGDIIHLKNNRIDLIEELLNESDAPAIVFGWHTELVTHLAKTLNVPCIYGETPQLDRRLIVEQFQAGEIKTIIANPRTIGHGLTLTKASRIVFAQIPDSLEYYLQAVSRMERIGQKQSMVVYHLFSPPEMRLLKSLKYKQALAADLNEFKLILSELKEAVAVQ